MLYNSQTLVNHLVFSFSQKKKKKYIYIPGKQHFRTHSMTRPRRDDPRRVHPTPNNMCQKHPCGKCLTKRLMLSDDRSFTRNFRSPSEELRKMDGRRDDSPDPQNGANTAKTSEEPGNTGTGRLPNVPTTRILGHFPIMPPAHPGHEAHGGRHGSLRLLRRPGRTPPVSRSERNIRDGGTQPKIRVSIIPHFAKNL